MPIEGPNDERVDTDEQVGGNLTHIQWYHTTQEQEEESLVASLLRHQFLWVRELVGEEYEEHTREEQSDGNREVEDDQE